MKARTLRDILVARAAADARRTFLVAPETGRSLSYGELARRARILASWLKEAGLAPGDKVGLLLHNSYQMTVLFLGTMAAGYVVAPLNLLSHRAQLAYVIEHCDCRLLFTSREYEAQLAEVLGEVKRKFRIIVIDPDAAELFVTSAEPSALAPVPANRPALLIYTSGTTGKPKGALLTHANLVAAARAVAAWHGLGPDDRCLSSLPLYHVNGQVIATIAPFVSGGSVIAPHKFSLSGWWNMVAKYKATWVNMVPTIIAFLLNGAEAGRAYRFPSVRFGRSASAPLPPSQHQAFERTFGVPVIEAMGMTESASVAFINPQEAGKRKYGSLGLPCGVKAKVIEPDSGAALPEGQQGEICIRGPNVMSSYYKAADLTDNAFTADRWLRTGDLGYRDADGFYYITGRLKELISKGGEKIAPREIDEALLRHPAILEAAAAGIPDRNYGQDILACIVLRPGMSVTAEELRRYCHDELGHFKTPKEFRFVSALPKGPSGKVQRLKLAETSG